MRDLKQLGLSARGSTNLLRSAIRNCTDWLQDSAVVQVACSSPTRTARGPCEGRGVAVRDAYLQESTRQCRRPRRRDKTWQWWTSKARKGQSRDTWRSRRKATGRVSSSSTHGGV